MTLNPLQVELCRTGLAAQRADCLFEQAIHAAGYKSRWDWRQSADPRQNLITALDVKITADRAHHDAWEAIRKEAQR